MPGSIWMLELRVTALAAYQDPPFGLKPLDDFGTVHAEPLLDMAPSLAIIGRSLADDRSPRQQP